MRPPEEVKRDLVRQWLAKAEEDLEVVAFLLSSKRHFMFAIGFHAQQAAEKYLKAFLTWHQVEFPKTHDLGVLLELVATADSVLAASLNPIISLNPYGVELRYPGDAPELSQNEAQDALKWARKTADEITVVLRECT